MKSFLYNDNLNLKLRQRMVECYVWLVLLYGVEWWTMKVRTMNQLEAFEMNSPHRMIAKISAWKMVQWQPRGKLSLVPEVAPYTPASASVAVLDSSVNQTSPWEGRIEL